MSDTRRRIIEATLRLLGEHGMSGITMTAVAESAGVARQTLYNHFPGVEEIVTAALDAHRVDIGDELQIVLDTFDEPAQRLAHLVRHVAASAAHHAPMPMFAAGLSAQVRATLHEHDETMRSVIGDVLRAGKVSGDFRSDLDPACDAQLIQAMLQRVPELATTNSDPAEIVAVVTRTVLAAVR